MLYISPPTSSHTVLFQYQFNNHPPREAISSHILVVNITCTNHSRTTTTLPGDSVIDDIVASISSSSTAISLHSLIGGAGGGSGCTSYLFVSGTVPRRGVTLVARRTIGISLAICIVISSFEFEQRSG